jgi:hypothetical protein
MYKYNEFVTLDQNPAGSVTVGLGSPPPPPGDKQSKNDHGECELLIFSSKLK